MFFHVATGSFIEFARFQPDERPVEDFIELSHGQLTGWSMNKDYVELLVATAIANAGKGDLNRVDRY